MSFGNRYVRGPTTSSEPSPSARQSTGFPSGRMAASPRTGNRSRNSALAGPGQQVRVGSGQTSSRESTNPVVPTPVGAMPQTVFTPQVGPRTDFVDGHRGPRLLALPRDRLPPLGREKIGELPLAG